MKKFVRRINQEFIEALNDLYEEKESFWHKMVKDPELFIAIREDYISVYYLGNAICELRFQNGKVVGKTHYKYLLHPDKDNDEYLFSHPGSGRSINPENYFIKSLNDFHLIKKSSKVYSGDEKAGVHNIVISDNSALDIEITLSDPSSRTKRIDYLILEEINGQLFLVFHEAKHFSNRKELRAQGTSIPKVLNQINNYQALLRFHENEIKESYKLVCNNLLDLSLSKPDNAYKLKRVAEGEELLIDYQPRLIIFGFDEDQKNGKIWEPHRTKLCTSLGQRLILRG